MEEIPSSNSNNNTNTNNRINHRHKWQHLRCKIIELCLLIHNLNQQHIHSRFMVNNNNNNLSFLNLRVFNNQHSNHHRVHYKISNNSISNSNSNNNKISINNSPLCFSNLLINLFNNHRFMVILKRIPINNLNNLNNLF